jgi:hypothetical protein
MSLPILEGFKYSSEIYMCIVFDSDVISDSNLPYGYAHKSPACLYNNVYSSFIHTSHPQHVTKNRAKIGQYGTVYFIYLFIFLFLLLFICA